jgi:uncharacterized protein with von Willebrand factor type A (vWA) domain
MADPAEAVADPADPEAVAEPDLAVVAARFAAQLRAAGLNVGPDRSSRFAGAVALADPQSTMDLYWCGRVTLVADPAEIPVFDRVFKLIFGGVTDSTAAERGDRNAPPVPSQRESQQPPAEGASPQEGISLNGGQGRADGSSTKDSEGDERESPVPTVATAAERLGGRDFATLSAHELAQLLAVMRSLRLATPLRRSRRYEPGSRGRRIDLRTTMRHALRSGGYPTRLARHRLKQRPRKLVVLCDISGSMEPYARALLQLVYAAAASGGPKAEVFTFATRLTRLTRVLAKVRPEIALELAGQAAPDWSGGTRIGVALKHFLDRYGARGMARGAIVLIISDGWETGDAALLGQQMARLSKLAYRIVWANPRTAAPRYQPLVAGMAAAWPYCDCVVSAHSLSALDALLTAIAQP